MLYPEVCQVCNAARATAEQSFLCLGCRSKARVIERPFCEKCGAPFEGELTQKFECANCRDLDLSFRYARSAVLARDPVLDVIHRYKYKRALWFEPFLGELLIRAAQAELRREDWDLIVPIPLHPSKERHREFNQAERLAARLSAATQIPLNRYAVRRVVATRSQTQLSRRERVANVRKAFAMLGGNELKGERIVLVDDVFTTGATASACARVLLAGGAGAVCVWTVARGH